MSLADERRIRGDRHGMCRVGRIVLVYLHQADRVADLEARAVARELHADIDMAEILRGRVPAAAPATLSSVSIVSFSAAVVPAGT